MKAFTFENNNNDFVLKDLDPPREWSNYLWNDNGYIVKVTHNATGKSYCIDDRANLCELNSNENKYFYLRDDDTLNCWGPGEGPLGEEVENYQCIHSIAFTRITSKKNNIVSEFEVFVPLDGFCEVWTVKLKNHSKATRNISLFSVTDFSLQGFSYPRYHEMSRTLTAGFEPGLNGVFCKSSHHWAPHARYNAFISSSHPIASSTANIKEYLGTNGSFSNPQALLKGVELSNSSRSGYDLGGVIRNKLTLQPNEEKELTIVLGLATSVAEAEATTKYFSDATHKRASMDKSSGEIYARYETLTVDTPDPRVNAILNNWAKKQVDFCIVGKKGVRDNAQISSALLMYRPQQARREILEILRHQYRSGNAVLTWLPLDETRYSDQAFWIIWSITELIKETGDYDVLAEVVEYQDGGEGTVLEHLKAAVDRLLEDRGPNGLVKIYFADWNDALNVTDDPEAESVMLSQQFCLALKEFARLCNCTGDHAYEDFLLARYHELADAINTKAWDGKWYRRVLSAKGNIGSAKSHGSTIYINPQVWGVLSGIPDKNKKNSILQAVDAMEHDFGFPINKPPYTEYSSHIGRMGLMLPGLYENGGVYCHASAFKLFMDCHEGRGNAAYRTLTKLIPGSSYNPYTQSGTEPFVFTNCYSLHPGAYGKADRSWITSTSAWCLKGLYEGILGIRKDYKGLKIIPCLPDNWQSVKVERTFRGTKYRIEMTVQASEVDKLLRLEVDGTEIESEYLPLFNDQDIHHVKVVIGKNIKETKPSMK